ncbi:unnamed protein product [Ilex paraguariensis]|uniref:Wall-associated receptor kinase galacturonan-binding domain-containing protein n=1 Tax=Ilex paraguariensis TaxID=185542 RepID=A0ABC8S0A4_9AQUA
MTMIIVSILSNIPMLQCQENGQYATCGNSFQCGNIRNIGYPFSGQNRPSFCGHPGFQLNCQGSALLITIQSMDYRVLAIDNRTQTLTVARHDMWNNICPIFFYNTTIDFPIFNNASNQQNVTLHYGCIGLNPVSPLPNQFYCSVIGGYGPNYLMIGLSPVKFGLINATPIPLPIPQPLLATALIDLIHSNLFIMELEMVCAPHLLGLVYVKQ